MTRKSALVGVGVVSVAALGGAIALVRCAGQEREPPETAAGVEPAASVTEAASADADRGPRTAGKSVAPAAPDASPPEDDSEPAPSASANALSDAPPSGSAGNSINRALGASHPPDLALLGRIERELHRDPPPEVHAMLRRRAEGASRDELLGMGRALPDLQLRVLVLRWVDEVRPGPNTGARTPTVPTPGSATPLVKPIEPRR